MKKNLMIIAACMTLAMSSCVWTESVEDVIAQEEEQFKPEEWVAETRSSNGLVCGNDGNYVFTDIDWSNQSEDPLKDYVSGKDGYIAYLYDGVGGTFVRDGSGVGIRYGQPQTDVFNARFNYAVADVQDPEQQSPLVFHDAFAGIKLKVTNRISNLYLEIKDFKLANIAREGLFMFPQDGKVAQWTDLTPGGWVGVTTDTLSVCPGDSVLLPANDALPVIPQSVAPWSAKDHPVYGGGTYLLLGCRICYTSDKTEKGTMVWCGENESFAYAAIPVSFDARIGETCTIEIVMENDCPWYSLRYANPTKILQPITFAPSVDDWIDASSNINI